MQKLIYIFLIIVFFGCDNQRLNQEPITIEASFRQYACGDWNDDMGVLSVEDTTFNFLVNKDIDPIILNGEEEITGWFYDNETEESRMNFRLSGYISKCAKSGCDKTTPKFWITHIEKLNGSEFVMKKGSN